MDTFSSLGVREDLATALSSFGFSGPSIVQTQAMRALFQGKDALISSATGSGKTFAYLVPALQALESGSSGIKILVVAPTHELSVQIQHEFERLTRAATLPHTSLLAVGSIPVRRLEERLHHKPVLVVGTPGRIHDLSQAGILKLHNLRFAILDEADRLFEKENFETTGNLLDLFPQECLRVLVSATLPPKTREKASKWFRDPVLIHLDNTLALKENIEHWAFHKESRKKADFIRSFEAAVHPKRCLVFVSSNASVFELSAKLEHMGLPAMALGSSADKTERKDAMESFRSGELRYLVTSELGARGIDVPDIDFILNADLPEDTSVYVHRAGRTGRAGKRGISVVIADLVELRRASRCAVRYGFSFRCKVLDSGKIFDIEPEIFFTEAEEAETRKPKGKFGYPKRP